MIKFDFDSCNGCGICVRRCPFNAVSIIGKQPSFGEGCLLCGICQTACPQKAISINTESKPKDIDFSTYTNVWVLLEINVHNSLKKVSFELLSKARELADELNQNVSALCLCKKEPNKIVRQIEYLGCDELIIVENNSLEHYNSDVFTSIICDLITKRKPNIVLFPATENGRDLAPRIACRLRLGLTADCTAFSIDKCKQLVQTRPTYGGNIMASIITPNHRPQMATVRPNVFKIIPCKKDVKTRVVKIDLKINSSAARIKRLGETNKEIIFKDVSEAEVVVAGGYGVGKENFKLLYELAAKMGAAVGATRKVVDEGWVPFEVQIGQTGKTVAPRLYIAFGISGALQHSIGIRNSQKIIAINSDPRAPIFSQADVSVLGDANQILKELIALI